ncbi:MAG: hypothetical protein AAF533_04800 [Acidobacteriota bacterium]
MKNAEAHRLSEMFYKHFPIGKVSSGDIYSGLPTFGLLPQERASGIIITPACDLAQSKTPTATYLPIVSIGEYLCTRDCRRRLINSLKGQLQRPGGKGLPSRDDELIEAAATALGSLDKNNGLRPRLDGFQRYIRAVSQGDTEEAGQAFLDALPSKDAKATLDSAITNGSLNTDTHFLPTPSSELKAFEKPSVALFRYPITVPYECLALAEDIDGNDGEQPREWSELVDGLAEPLAGALTTPPLRCQRLRSDFMADLATRFASLYVRIGSPDLDGSSVEQLRAHIGNSP